MFNQQLVGKIRSITAKVSEVDKQISRSDIVAIMFEFTRELAGGINKDAVSVQKQLTDGVLKTATMLMDGIGLEAEFAAKKDKLIIKDSKGMAMSLKRANKEDAHPTAEFTMCFPTVEKNHCFFVRHLEESVDIKLTKTQTELEV